MKISQLDLLDNVKTFIESNDGVSTLFPPQAKTIRAGLLEGNNLIAAIPTASGKTLIAELCALKHILELGGKAVYLCPLRALASEKFEDFKRFNELGVSVTLSSGDYDSSDYWLQNNDLIVTTNEKMDAILRHGAPWFDSITLIVIDEIHLLNDPDRGPTLETLITKARLQNSNAQILGLSATIRNAKEIADWLDAELVESTWRPIPLTEGYFYDGTIVFPKKVNIPLASLGPAPSSKISPVCWLAIDTIKDGGQSLVFTTSRRQTVNLAKKIAIILKKVLSKEDKIQLEKISQKINRLASDPISEQLSEFVRHGVAFHHAGLGSSERKIIEDEFRGNNLKIITATPTLASGVNLPARRVIIDSIWRYSSEGQEPIPVMEYKQQAGRAGRPKYDQFGEAVLIARNEKEGAWLTKKYIKAKPEEVTSKLATEPALRQNLLGLIASKIVENRNTLNSFLKKTLLFNQSAQFDTDLLKERVDKILSFLEHGKFTISNPNEIIATKYGIRVSQLYIDPLSANIMSKALETASAERVMGGITPFSLLHLISSTPDLNGPFLRKQEFEILESVVENREEEFLGPIPEPWSVEFEYFLSQVKITLLLEEWISETHISTICTKYAVGSGDVSRYVETAKWLLYAIVEIARVNRNPLWISKLAKEVQMRIQYGVKESLIDLCKISGIGRVRGRLLYRAGIKSPSELREILDSRPKKVLQIPGFGPELLESLKKQFSDQKNSETLDSSSSPLFEETLQKRQPRPKNQDKRLGTLDDYFS